MQMSTPDAIMVRISLFRPAKPARSQPFHFLLLSVARDFFRVVRRVRVPSANHQTLPFSICGLLSFGLGVEVSVFSSLITVI